jgi:hypothetical protein
MLVHVLTGAPPVAATPSPQSIPADLSAIVAKALAPLPADRYRDAKALADDLRRYQRGQLVSVHRYSTREVFGRWLRRHRTAAIVAGIGFAVLSALAILSFYRIRNERNVALREKRQATDALARERAAMEEARRQTNGLLLSEATRIVTSDPTRSIELLGQLRNPAPTDEEAMLEVAEQANARGVSSFVYRRTRGKDVVPFATDAQGVILALAGDSMQVWDTTAKRKLLDLALAPEVTAVRVTPSGDFVATGHRDGSMYLWDVARGSERSLPASPGGVMDLAFSSDGRWLASGDYAGYVS